MAARRIVAQSIADRGEDDEEGDFTRDQLTAFFERMSKTRSALLKVMVNRYMRKHGLDDAPDKSTPGGRGCGGGGLREQRDTMEPKENGASNSRIQSQERLENV
eukprot:sb/3478045/